MSEYKSWLIRFYDKDEVVIESYVVNDRTESEAEKEAWNEVNKNPLVEEWSMEEF